MVSGRDSDTAPNRDREVLAPPWSRKPGRRTREKDGRIHRRVIDLLQKTFFSHFGTSTYGRLNFNTGYSVTKEQRLLTGTYSEEMHRGFLYLRGTWNGEAQIGESHSLSRIAAR